MQYSGSSTKEIRIEWQQRARASAYIPHTQTYIHTYSFSQAQQPNAGRGRLIVEVSTSHTMT
jgi:hypothetical protein